MVLPYGIQQRKQILKNSNNTKQNPQNGHNAPWYVRNTTVHTDITNPLVNELIKKTYDIHHRKMLLHVNHTTSHTRDCSEPTTTKTAHTTQEEETLRPDTRRLSGELAVDSDLHTSFIASFFDFIVIILLQL